MINSRFSLDSATLAPSTPHGRVKARVPLLPKLRGYFAEFLNHDSLARLSILYLTTCVGFGYGRLKPRVDAFLGSTGSSTFYPHQASPIMFPGFAWETGCAFEHAKPLGMLDYHSASHLLTRLRSTLRTPRLPCHAFPPKGIVGKTHNMFGMVSINVDHRDGFLPVPEYELVAHRLRLSASP